MRTFFTTLWFWSMGLTVTVVLFLVAGWRHLFVKLGLTPDDGCNAHEIASIWGRTIMRLTPGWSIAVDGREHLPPKGQAFVIVANHESMCDIFAMYYLGIQFRWLSKYEVFKIPFVGHAMRWSRYVPVVRGNGESQRQSMEESRKRLELGIPMFFFPEGTRSIDGNIKEFKTGAFRLARDLQVPVLPVAIHGAREMLRKGSAIPGISHVQIKILKALPPPDREGDLSSYTANVRRLIIEAHHSLQQTKHKNKLT